MSTDRSDPILAHDCPLPSYIEADLIRIAQLALHQLATNESRESKAGFTSPGDHSRPFRFSDRGISEFDLQQQSTINYLSRHQALPAGHLDQDAFQVK
jgi:hypothetical protein